MLAAEAAIELGARASACRRPRGRSPARPLVGARGALSRDPRARDGSGDELGAAAGHRRGHDGREGGAVRQRAARGRRGATGRSRVTPPAARLGRAGSRADPRGGRGRGRRGARARRRPRGRRRGPRSSGRVRARLGRGQRPRAHARDRVAGQAPGSAARRVAGRRRRRRPSSARGCRSIPTSRPASWPGCSSTTTACAALATRARCAWARSTPSSPTVSAGASPPTSRRRRARSCSRSAGATGTRSCCRRSACGASGCRRSARRFGRAGRARARALAGGDPADRAARRPAGRAGRLGRGSPGRAEGDLRHRRVRAGPHRRARARASGLLPTVAWAAPDASAGVGEVAHALDGGVFAAGSLLDWLADGSRPGGGRCRRWPRRRPSVADSAGVIVLPALAGLGAPWWRPGGPRRDRGAAPGASAPPTSRGRRSRRSPGASRTSSRRWPRSRPVHGAARGRRPDERRDAASDPGRRARACRSAVGRADATVLGAAMLAGVGAGVFSSVEQAAERLPPGRVVTPRVDDPRERARAARERWRAFVQVPAGSAAARRAVRQRPSLLEAHLVARVPERGAAAPRCAPGPRVSSVSSTPVSRTCSGTASRTCSRLSEVGAGAGDEVEQLGQAAGPVGHAREDPHAAALLGFVAAQQPGEQPAVDVAARHDRDRRPADRREATAPAAPPRRPRRRPRRRAWRGRPGTPSRRRSHPRRRSRGHRSSSRSERQRERAGALDRDAVGDRRRRGRPRPARPAVDAALQRLHVGRAGARLHAHELDLRARARAARCRPRWPDRRRRPARPRAPGRGRPRAARARACPGPAITSRSSNGCTNAAPVVLAARGGQRERLLDRGAPQAHPRPQPLDGGHLRDGARRAA